jgi:hypothetical protein
MLQFIQQILLRVQGDTLKLLVLAGVLLLAWGTLAPVGTLIWWLQEGAESLGLKNQARTNYYQMLINRVEVLGLQKLTATLSFCQEWEIFQLTS